MKQIFLLSLSSFLFLIVACEKEASQANGAAALSLSAAEARTGEAVEVSLLNTSANTVSRWSVTPNTGVQIDSVYSYQQNTIVFENPGTYTISADVRKVHPSCLPSPGWDTCYTSKPSAGSVSKTVTVKN